MIIGVTSRAKNALKEFFADESIGNPVVSIVKAKVVESGKMVYGIAIDDDKDFNIENIVEIDGIKFMVDKVVERETKNKYLDIDASGKFRLADKSDNQI